MVLSRNRKLYSTRRLVEAAESRGMRAEVVDTLRLSIVVQKGRPALLYEGRELGDVDVVIPRIGASITTYGLAVLRQLEAMGIPVLNPADGVANSRDKLRCLQVLAAHGIDVPATVMARRTDDLKDAVKRIGGLPAIVKLIQGTQGIGVMIAHSTAEIASILDTMWDLGQEIILQQFIAESKGVDIRVLVVGDRAVGAMRRKARRGDFRSNIHRGGAGRRIKIPRSYEEQAVRAAKMAGLQVAGVDLLESSRGPVVMEVNSSPGLEAIERTTSLDIAGMIIDHALARAGVDRSGSAAAAN